MDDVVMVPPIGTDHTCSGPMHGRDTLPKGYRAWTPGQVLSLTQLSESGGTHNVYCSIECFCDWHGHFEALMQGSTDPDAQIPGSFNFMWISPHGSRSVKYDTWDDLTQYIGRYQAALVEQGVW